MAFWFRRGIQHPLFPQVRATPATAGKADCAILSGSFGELVQAGLQGVRAGRAVLVLTEEGAPVLSDRSREQLWALFQAPIFAMVTNAEGEVIAYECEAQEGLHLSPGWAGGTGRIATELCGCGRSGARWLPHSDGVF